MLNFTRMRPSNFVLFAALPFIIYLFATAPNYQRSLSAIVGVEDGALRYFRDFLLIAATLLLGLALPFADVRGWLARPRFRTGASAAAVASVVLAGLTAWSGDISALGASILANLLDPALSDLVVKAVTPRRLTPEAMMMVSDRLRMGLWVYAGLAGLLTAIALAGLASAQPHPVVRLARQILLIVNGAGLLFLLLMAHLGFASGLFTSIRAGVFAYLLAAVLGLLWATLLRLSATRRTLISYAIASAAMLMIAGVLFLQAKETWVLIGSPDKAVAIVKGTPKALVDSIRFAEFAPALKTEIALRSTVTPEHALRLMAEGSEVSGAFVPAAAAPAGAPELWRTSFLPSKFETPAIALLVTGLLTGLLTFSAFQHGRHPLSVGAEFFIDTVRGIPMLVIILFVGLPLSGAVKDATSGAIDLPNVMRGVIAIALGYSAYLAEIFRAGIEAVPRGQIEAARTLGLSNWQLARLIVFPQALRVIIPPLGNEFIAMLKDTSLLSILSVRDVTQRMREFQSASFLPFAPFNTAAILYVCVTLAAASLISFIERKYHVKTR